MILLEVALNAFRLYKRVKKTLQIKDLALDYYYYYLKSHVSNLKNCLRKKILRKMHPNTLALNIVSQEFRICVL